MKLSKRDGFPREDLFIGGGIPLHMRVHATWGVLKRLVPAVLSGRGFAYVVCEDSSDAKKIRTTAVFSGTKRVKWNLAKAISEQLKNSRFED